MDLPDNELHVWLVDLEAVDAQCMSRYRALMSESELARNQRFRFEADRLANGVTRALVRTTLSKYLDTEPANWQFQAGDHGKPEISGPAMQLPLRFNLSHSGRYIACAVTLAIDVGIDIEHTVRKNDVLQIADRYFSYSEVSELFELEEHRQRDRFFDYWTLKEAYMKARGEGISLGLGNFSFHLPEQGQIGISFSAQLDDDPAAWQFGLFRPKPDHRLAYALRLPPQHPARVKLFQTVPLSGEVRELPASPVFTGDSGSL